MCWVLVPPSLASEEANAVGEEHLQTWHVLNVHKCTVGETIHGSKGFINGMRLRIGNGIFPCSFAFFEV